MRWRTVGRVAATVLAGLVAAGAVAAVGIAEATGEIYTARDGGAPSAGSTPPRRRRMTRASRRW
jgi:hypothetical protein